MIINKKNEYNRNDKIKVICDICGLENNILYWYYSKKYIEPNYICRSCTKLNKQVEIMPNIDKNEIIENNKNNICNICKVKFPNNKNLIFHIVNNHNIKIKNYYDTYHRRNKEGVCKICGKTTYFRSWRLGYNETCSNKCNGQYNKNDKIMAANIQIHNRYKEIFANKNIHENFKKYKNAVMVLTKKNRIYLLNLWNGTDYYDGEYIKNNFTLKYLDNKYPSIDHKISIYYGFVNKISIDFIGSLNNLCFTKRIHNIKKHIKCEKEYLCNI